MTEKPRYRLVFIRRLNVRRANIDPVMDLVKGAEMTDTIESLKAILREIRREIDENERAGGRAVQLRPRPRARRPVLQTACEE